MTATTFSPSPTAQATVPSRPILVDGLFCTTVGVIGTFVSGPVSTFMGLPTPAPVLILGVITLVYGLFLTGWALTRPMVRAVTRAAIGLNIVSVMAFLVILIANLITLTDGGRWIMVILAVDMTLLGIWQWASLRR